MDHQGLLPPDARTLSTRVHVVGNQPLPAADIPDPDGPDHPPIPVPPRLCLELRFDQGFTARIGDVPATDKGGLIGRWRTSCTPVGVYAVRYLDLYPPPQDPQVREKVRDWWVLRLIDGQGGWVDVPVGRPVMDRLATELRRRS